jgi:hypothetical protein
LCPVAFVKAAARSRAPEKEPMPLRIVMSADCAAPWLTTARTPAAAIVNHVLIVFLPIFS